MHPALVRPVRRHLSAEHTSEAVNAVLDSASRALYDLERDSEFTARTMEELSRELEIRLEHMRESESRYRMLFDSGPVATLLLRRADRVVLAWNTAAERTFGWTRDEIVGHPMEGFDICARGCAFALQLMSEDHIDATDITRTVLYDRDGKVVEAEVQGLEMQLGDSAAVLIMIRDVTAQHQAERSARNSAARFAAFFGHTGIAIQVLTMTGVITEANPACFDMLGFKPAELVGKSLATLLVASDGDRLPLACQDVMTLMREAVSMELQCVHKDGRIVWGQLTLARVQRGEQPRLMAMLQDVTERKRMEQELERQAFRDDLTGLANRVLFRDRLQHALERRSRTNAKVAVLLLDLDGFKRVNDSLGHASGDALLRAIGVRIANAVRAGETVARLGGDEFAIVIESMQEDDDAMTLASRLLTAISQPVEIASREVVVNVSIGVAVSQDGEDDDTVLRNADTAMYAAKSLGKHCIRQFDPSMHARALVWLEIEQDLRRALTRNEFELHFQPLLRLDSGRLRGFEALLRWNHPRRGLISPADFLHVAEETGLVVEIGRWVLREACTRAATWTDNGEDGLPSISVNLAPRQLDHPELLAEVTSALMDSGLDPRRLILEITESEVMRHPEIARGRLEALRKLGIRVAIDDFGTGYSSLSHLQYFPVDELKIDRTFVSRLSNGEREASFVRTMLSLARSLGVEVVAEGIEEDSQRATLTTLGCDVGQGYLFSKPLSVTKLNAYLQQRADDSAKRILASS